MQDKSIPSYGRLITNDAQIKELIALSEYISKWKQEVDEYIVHDTSDKSFKDTWRTTGTLEQFCEDVVADSDAVVGQVYLGQLGCSGLPEGMANGEAEVKVTQGLSGKLLVITMTSTNLSPYHWEQSYYNGTLYGWKSWTTEEDLNTESLFQKNLAAIMSLAVDPNAAVTTVTTNPEWKLVYTDAEDRILLGKRQDDTWYFATDLDTILDVVIDGYTTT